MFIAMIKTELNWFSNRFNELWFVLSSSSVGESPIYESINFNAIVHADRHSYNKLNKLKRQDAIDDKIRNPSYCRDVKVFLERCIPPPPTEPPPPPSDEDDETIGLSPLEFSSETLEKLNSLYSLYKGSRSIGKVDDETADVEYRLPQFSGRKPRSLQDSTKAVCSLVSVLTSQFEMEIDKSLC